MCVFAERMQIGELRGSAHEGDLQSGWKEMVGTGRFELPNGSACASPPSQA